MKLDNIDSDQNLAQLLARIAEIVKVDAVICFTEKGQLAKKLKELDPDLKIIAATSDSETYGKLNQSDLITIRLPIHGINKYRQIPHLLSVALKSDSIAQGDLVLVGIGEGAYPEKGNLIALGEAEGGLKELSLKDLLKLTDGIRPAVLDTVVDIARRIGLISRRKKSLGTIFVLGDSTEVLRRSKQLVPNPFNRSEESKRMITDPGTHDSVIELAKLDGAFIIRGDGLIRTAGTFLGSESEEDLEDIHSVNEGMDLPEGLGTRHVASAAITACTEATAVVISETDGNIRVFSGGQMVMKMDPSMNYESINDRKTDNSTP